MDVGIEGYTIKEAAAKVGKSPKTVAGWTRELAERDLAEKVLGRWVIDRETVDRIAADPEAGVGLTQRHLRRRRARGFTEVLEAVAELRADVLDELGRIHERLDALEGGRPRTRSKTKPASRADDGLNELREELRSRVAAIEGGMSGLESTLGLATGTVSRFLRGRRGLSTENAEKVRTFLAA